MNKIYYCYYYLKKINLIAMVFAHILLIPMKGIKPQAETVLAGKNTLCIKVLPCGNQSRKIDFLVQIPAS